MKYKPKPFDTSGVKLSNDILELSEKLAKNAHDIWAKGRIAEGWTYGPKRDDERKEHPCLVTYEELPESEKIYDRNAAMQTLKATIALGYKIDVASMSDSSAFSGIEEEYLGLLKRLRSSEKLDLTELIRIWGSLKPSWRKESVELYQKLGERILKVGSQLLAYDVLNEGLGLWPEDVRLKQLYALSMARSGATHRANAILSKLRKDGHTDGETLGILARTHKDLWDLSADPSEKVKQLQKAQNIYHEAFTLALKANNLDDAIYTGINAASAALLMNQTSRAISLAMKVREVCLEKLEVADDYWALASLGEAAIILGDLEKAKKRYSKAAQISKGDIGDLSTTRHQARMLLDHLGMDKNCLDHCFNIPRVVVFAGHMIDQPGRKIPRFPQAIEKKVYHEIANKLESLNAGIGYSSAACGSDILFLEAMLERKAQINIVLPFPPAEFKKASVGIISNTDWEERFDKVMEKAARVIIASEHRQSGNEVAYDYANLLFDGLAMLRAKRLDTELSYLVVWDGQTGDGPGGTSSLVTHWKSRELEPEMIDITRLKDHAPTITTDTKSSETGSTPDAYWVTHPEDFPQEIRAMLFFDVVGYSKLFEEQILGFVKYFMGAVDDIITEFPHKPLVKNTWGDALYCVFESVEYAGDFALKLRDRICSVNWKDKGLPENLNLRISLHAGPVFRCMSPVLKIENYEGSHVSRTARIEPITPAGEVYASQQFAALAAVQGVTQFTCDYVGQMPLPKDSGIIPLYLVRQRHT